MPATPSPVNRGKLKPPPFWPALLFALSAAAGAYFLFVNDNLYLGALSGILAAISFGYLMFEYPNRKAKHEELLKWLAANEPVCIFFYTTKKTFLSISENTIIPMLPQGAFLVKEDQNRFSTAMPSRYWSSIRRQTIPKGRPVLIRFEKDHYVVINLKSDCEALRSKAIDERAFSKRVRIYLEIGVKE